MKSTIKFAVRYIGPKGIVTIENISDFKEAVELATKTNGYVYNQIPIFGIADRIWPIKETTVTGKELNEALLCLYGAKGLLSR